MLERFKTLRVLIVVPSTGLWMADFGSSLCNLMAAFALFRIGAYKSQIAQLANYKGSILSKSRYLAVEEARKEDYDYLLFVDSDQTFPRKMLHLMISREKDIVAANVATKVLPAQPTARNRGQNHAKDPWDWVPVYTDEGSKGIEQVDRIGTGIILLSKRAYSVLEPWDWDTRWREDVKAIQGEDWGAMEAFEKARIPIFIDHDLSQEVGHVGFYTFTHSDVGDIPTPEQIKAIQEARRQGIPSPLARATEAAFRQEA